AARWVDGVRMRIAPGAVGEQETLPLPSAGPPAREVRIDARGANRQLAGLVVGDVGGVEIEPIEGAGLFGGGAQKIFRAVDEVRIVPFEKRRRRTQLVEPGGPLQRDRDGNWLSRCRVQRGRTSDDRAVDRALDLN